MMKAWKLPDGRYRLAFDGFEEERPLFARFLVGDRIAFLENGTWMCKAEDLDALKAEKVFGVVTGPSSCGCEPAGFRWVGESEVKAGQTRITFCFECSTKYGIENAKIYATDHQCDIIDVCGEADVAEAVYEAEFRALVER